MIDKLFILLDKKLKISKDILESIPSNEKLFKEIYDEFPQKNVASTYLQNESYFLLIRGYLLEPQLKDKYPLNELVSEIKRKFYDGIIHKNIMDFRSIIYIYI